MASKTYAELAVATDLQGGDLLATYRGVGPLKSLTATLARDYFQDGTVLADGSVAMTGALQAYVGSEALPGVAFSADTDTGIYRVGANSLGIATGGVNRVTVDSSGVTATTFIGNLTGNVTGGVTGNAATATKWATARNLSLTGDGTATLSSVDGSAAVSAALTLATVNANVGAFGSASAVATFTVNSKGLLTAAAATTISITDSNLSAAVGVAKGGTGAATLTNHGVVIGQGTSTVAVTAAGTAGQPLLSGGASADPAYGALGVAGGGTGASTFTDGGVLVGNAAGAVQATTAGTAGQVLTSNGAGVDPTFQTPATITYTQIGSTTTVSSPVASVIFSSIPATYGDLFLDISAASNDGGGTPVFHLYISTDNGSNWSANPFVFSFGTRPIEGALRISRYRGPRAVITGLGQTGSAALDIVFAASGTGSAASIVAVTTATGASAGAINALKITASAGNVSAGAFSLYGV